MREFAEKEYGRPYPIGGFADLLLAIVVYLRANAGYELLGLVFNVDQSTVKRAVKRVSVLLQDRFLPKTTVTGHKRRTNDLDEFLKDYHELEDVIFDGSELPVQRPKRGQTGSYSGKKKRHTKKIQVATDKNTRLIIGVSKIEKGRIHYKKHLEKTGWDDRMPKGIKRRGDSGYQGMHGESWIIPEKKPRTSELAGSWKMYNRKKAGQRIYAEHSIRGMKVFRRIGELIKIKSDEFLNEAIMPNFMIFLFHKLKNYYEIAILYTKNL